VGEYIQIIQQAQLPLREPVLEPATRSGRMTAVLTLLGFNVSPGDLSHEQDVKTLNRVTPAYSHEFRPLLLDMKKLPIRDHSARTIVCLNTLHELDNPRICMSELI
ncbi:MAG: methyltransferase domain-containing protein, partial [Bacteroidota bacterium]